MKTINVTDEEQAELIKLRAKKTAKATSTESSDVVRAGGTSEGVKKSWELRKSHASGLTSFADKVHLSAMRSDSPADHEKAATAHDEASKAHGEMSGHESFKDDHEDFVKFHKSAAESHRSMAQSASVFGGGAERKEVIHCRSHSAAGSVLAADKPWSPGEQVEFMWMPAGTSTICAGFRKGSIELTVNCDENTAAAVQASLESWREERPKQEPFGCIEHKEQEASFRVGASCGFKWNNDGVYLAAEPTTLGANNVNGRVHRSWSPSFTTDADYSKATERGGVLMFPEGARGSRSNPAQITGVDFCVGTLTNKPAFHSMSPVKASDAVQAGGTSEGAKKGWEGRKGVGPIDADAASEHLKEASRYYSGDYGEKAHLQSAKAFTSGKASDHKLAAKFHQVMAGNAYSPAHGAASREVSKHHVEMSKHEDAAQATDTSSADSIKADCAHTLKQDVPDATPAEVACYEKCIEDGGSHTRAVEEIRKQRNPAAKASEPMTPDTILARQASALEQANAIATEHGVARTTLDDVYSKCAVTATGTSEAVKATWSDAAREAALASRKAHGLSKGAMANNPFVKDGMIHMNTAPSRAFAEAHASYAVKHADKGNHSTAATRHKDAAEGHRSFAKQKDTPDKASHLAAAEAHDHAASLHKALKGSANATDATPQDILNKIYASSGHSTNVVKAHCGKLLGLLGSLRAAHWNAPTQTNDHEALGELYETLDGLVDEYVESSMGKKPEKVTPESCDCDPNDPAAVLDAGERIVTGMRGDREDLNNLVADMEKAINKTRYLLKAGAAGGPIQTSDKSVDDILNSIYARAETVSATWSDAARKAAAEARKRAHPSVNELHDDHFGKNTHEDDSGYNTHGGKWASPKRTHALMQQAYEAAREGEHHGALNRIAKENFGHETFDKAAQDQSGAYNSSRKWLSVSKHAEAIKDAYDAGRSDYEDDEDDGGNGDDKAKASDKSATLQSIYARAGETA